jgi:hypothetical protein
VSVTLILVESQSREACPNLIRELKKTACFYVDRLPMPVFISFCGYLICSENVGKREESSDEF